MHEKFVNKKYSSDLLTSLNSLRIENQLCDVILKISNTSIPAHKNILAASSPYFHAMFCGTFSESSKKDVVLYDLDPLVMEDLVYYMYTGEIEIDTDNVQNVLSVATFLQMTFVQKNCCDYLKDALEPSNCIGIKRFAGKNDCFELQKYAGKFAAGCFHEVVECEEFLQLNFDELLDLLSNQTIHHHTDDIIFSGIMRWVNHDPPNRSKDINKLLEFVHPLLVGKDLVKQQDLLIKTQSCSEWVSKSLHSTEIECNIFFLDKIGETGDLYRYGLKTKTTVPLAEFPEKAFAISMVGYKNSLLIQGGAIDRKSTRNHYSYNIYRNNWMKLSPLIVSRSHHRSCLLNDLIYTIGGTNAIGSLADVEVYDLYTGRSFDIELMCEERTSLGAAVLDNQLYVMGGENDSQCLSTAARFDPRVGYWETIASMNQVNSYCSSAVISGSVYCSEGIGNCMERYDNRMNCWEMIEFKSDREFYELFSIDNVLYSISGTGIYKYCFVDNEWTSVLEFEQLRSWDTAFPLDMKIL